MNEVKHPKDHFPHLDSDQIEKKIAVRDRPRFYPSNARNH